LQLSSGAGELDNLRKMASAITREDRAQATDLATMWQEALLNYYTHAGLPPQMKVYARISDIMQDTEIQKNFEKVESFTLLGSS
jgi:hypothetical protein